MYRSIATGDAVFFRYIEAMDYVLWLSLIITIR
jgi:hypothetical protein